MNGCRTAAGTRGKRTAHAYPERVTLSAVPALVIGVALGLLIGWVLAAVLRRRPAESPAPAARPPGVLDTLPVAVLVLGADDEVLLSNRAVDDLGLTHAGVLSTLPELRRLAAQARLSGRTQEADLQGVFRPGRAPAIYQARVAPVGDGSVAVVLEDVSDSRRLEDVRRDFVANVSHELKTPVGALSLLAEALQDASNDPPAVRRFAQRSHVEAQRLGRLVQELIDLSRLQGAEPMTDPVAVDVDQVVAEALDRTRTAAQARGIALTRTGEHGLALLGNEQQLVTALVNLLDNAVSYSGANSTVTVTTRATRGAVEIGVTDEGIGIPEKDLERVFERFYRSDPARSRATGGTGLGLAIVKHISTNHGGTVRVSSVEGEGATFTLRLPLTGHGAALGATGAGAERVAAP